MELTCRCVQSGITAACTYTYCRCPRTLFYRLLVPIKVCYSWAATCDQTVVVEPRLKAVYVGQARQKMAILNTAKNF